MKYKYVSLFSGAGGLDLGLERAGFEGVSLCEIENVFCDTLESNKGWIHIDGNIYFKNASIIRSDIRDLSSKDLYKGRKLDLIVAGPPCQSFSSSGKQLSILDARGALVNEFCRIIDELKPRMFLFENVRGLVTARNKKGEPGGVITELIHSLEEIGYSCKSNLLNSADFGAPQRRVRCFIIGSQKGEAPNFPLPEYSKCGELFSKKWVSLEVFLNKYWDQDESNYTYPTTELNKQLINIPSGSGLKSVGKPEPTRPGGHWGYRQGTFIADLNLPARTVTGSSSQDWIRWNKKLRRLTFKEISLLQGFPGDWIVRGNKSQRYKQIGNAVPAVFGEVLGNVIYQHLKNFPKGKPVHLGVPKTFKGYIDYTKRDQERNKPSRSVHLQFDDA